MSNFALTGEVKKAACKRSLLGQNSRESDKNSALLLYTSAEEGRRKSPAAEWLPGKVRKQKNAAGQAASLGSVTVMTVPCPGVLSSWTVP